MELLGHEAAWAAFSQAEAGGRLHHAWLLAGPRGMGKRAFADRVAQRLLGEGSGAALVAAGSHPDLRVLAPDPEKPASGILVDQVRALGPFLRSHPALGRHRVVILDAADDLNLSAANALLKSLEEPGEGLVFLLVAHAPGRLPATIRSRCRLLRFPPLPEPAVRSLLAMRAPELAEADRARLAALSGGAPGEALRLAEAGAGALLSALETEPPERFAERFAGKGGAEAFALLCALAPRVAALAARRQPDPERIARHAEVVALARDAMRPGEDRVMMAWALALALGSGKAAA
ncbi:MAG: DNA polymerase III subunit delta' [Thermaurantiacus tibetensis]|uniref:DNA polymerase III subunit delta' n=1 Tax=Thermaurantiacus tibetensis TaxID=2759035 RepID=UPI00188F3A2F|nr:DNA polymerase III subunit delta' [Thermaurantiacus tibetensis]